MNFGIYEFMKFSQIYEIFWFTETGLKLDGYARPDFTSQYFLWEW